METMRLVALILVHAMVIPATIFPLRYRLSRWNNEAGRPAMVMSIGFALVIDLSVALFWLRHFHGPDLDAYVSVPVYLICLTGMTWQTCVLIREQRRHKQDNPPE